MSTVFELGPFRNVHDIVFKSASGRLFTIDIYSDNNKAFDSEVTIFDRVSKNPVSQIFKTETLSSSAADNFQAGISLILKYLAIVDPSDMIADVHNPCNTPFISETEQNSILSQKGINLKVRTN